MVGMRYAVVRTGRRSIWWSYLEPPLLWELFHEVSNLVIHFQSLKDKRISRTRLLRLPIMPQNTYAADALYQRAEPYNRVIPVQELAGVCVQPVKLQRRVDEPFGTASSDVLACLEKKSTANSGLKLLQSQEPEKGDGTHRVGIPTLQWPLSRKHNCLEEAQ